MNASPTKQVVGKLVQIAVDAAKIASGRAIDSHDSGELYDFAMPVLLHKISR